MAAGAEEFAAADARAAADAAAFAGAASACLARFHCCRNPFVHLFMQNKTDDTNDPTQPFDI